MLNNINLYEAAVALTFPIDISINEVTVKSVATFELCCDDDYDER